jgi:hypothetical protein
MLPGSLADLCGPVWCPEARGYHRTSPERGGRGLKRVYVVAQRNSSRPPRGVNFGDRPIPLPLAAEEPG